MDNKQAHYQGFNRAVQDPCCSRGSMIVYYTFICLPADRCSVASHPSFPLFSEQATQQ